MIWYSHSVASLVLILCITINSIHIIVFCYFNFSYLVNLLPHSLFLIPQLPPSSSLPHVTLLPSLLATYPLHPYIGLYTCCLFATPTTPPNLPHLLMLPPPPLVPHSVPRSLISPSPPQLPYSICLINPTIVPSFLACPLFIRAAFRLESLLCPILLDIPLFPPCSLFAPSVTAPPLSATITMPRSI